MSLNTKGNVSFLWKTVTSLTVYSGQPYCQIQCQSHIRMLMALNSPITYLTGAGNKLCTNMYNPSSVLEISWYTWFRQLSSSITTQSNGMGIKWRSGVPFRHLTWLPYAALLSLKGWSPFELSFSLRIQRYKPVLHRMIDGLAYEPYIGPGRELKFELFWEWTGLDQELYLLSSPVC